MATDSADNSITVTDNRTGETKKIPIEDGCVVPATAFAAFRAPGDRHGLRLFDPGYMNTAVVHSSVTLVDGERGELRYRGYAIEDLCERYTFLEVAYLLINGQLPSTQQSKQWTDTIMTHTFVHEDLLNQMRCFRYDAHPMGMLASATAAMSTFHPEANPALSGADIFKRDISLRNKQIFRILGKLPTLAAASYRHRIGRPYNYPATTGNLSYTENLIYMMDKLTETDYRPHPRLAKALDVLFILHADHELNCSTAAVRHLASSGVDPYTAIAGGIGALYGPQHGGANEAVLRMLEEIGSVENIPAFLEEVKARKRRLSGFGHRIYKLTDPRARIIRRYVDEVFAILGVDPLLEVAQELERQALADEYFVKRRLFPNVDFYSGLIYRAMGVPTDMFPVLFALPRAAGWLAHWVESLDDKERRIYRPRQVYSGEGARDPPQEAEGDAVQGVGGRSKLLRFHARL